MSELLANVKSGVIVGVLMVIVNFAINKILKKSYL